MKIKIVMNSVIDELWEKSRSLVEHPFWDIVRTEHHDDFLQNCVARLQYDADYIIWMEEDVFVFNRKVIIDTINRMQVNDLDFIAMPELGGSSHRAHYPGVRSFCMFFCIFKMKNIKPLGITKQALQKFPKILSSDEAHWAFFDYLESRGMKYLPFAGKDWNEKGGDGLSTWVISPAGAEFALHTWYAREYQDHKARIQNAYVKAKELYVN